MKNLKLFAIAIIIGGLAGCISIGSKQPDKTTEKESVIVVPQKNNGDTGY